MGDTLLSITVKGAGIKSLKGIEYVTTLGELDCSGNELTELDLSQNLYLGFLDCSNNKLTTLDVTRQRFLTTLFCQDNQLTTLSLGSKNAHVLFEDDSYKLMLDCSNNKLTTIDLSKCTSLSALDCSHNEISELDVTNNPVLDSLYCTDNKLLTLDLSMCPDLFLLECSGNEISELELTNNAYLYSLNCNRNKLVSLDISNNQYLSYLNCSLNNISTLTLNNFFLSDLICISNDLKEIDITSCTSLSAFYCAYNQLSTIDTSANTQLTSFDCTFNALNTLTVNNPSLRILMCNDNNMTALDISKSVNLEELYCYNNQLSTLDISANTKLSGVYCGNNSLTNLDVSSNSDLVNLGCSENDLHELDVSKNLALVNLDCGSNDHIGELDLSNNTELEELTAHSTGLSELDVSKNTKLTYLSCEGSFLVSIDVSMLKDLEILGVSGCLLKSIDVSNNTKLRHFNCTYNELVELDLSNNKDLETLACYDNKRINLKAEARDNSEYPWQVNLKDYVGDNLENVSNLKGYDSGNREINSSFDEAAGIALFAGGFHHLEYDYDLGYTGSADLTEVPRTMKVTLSINSRILLLPEYDKTKYELDISLTSDLIKTMTEAIPGIMASDVYTLGSIATGTTWEPSTDDTDAIKESGWTLLYALPEVKATANGAYVMTCKFGDDVKSGDKISLYDCSDYVVTSATTPVEYSFIGDDNKETETVPPSKQANLAIKLSSGQTFKGAVITNSSSSTTPSPTKNEISDGSSSGCNAGLSSVLILVAISLIARRKIYD